jgi:hypothetical protein
VERFGVTEKIQATGKRKRTETKEKKKKQQE